MMSFNDNETNNGHNVNNNDNDAEETHSRTHNVDETHTHKDNDTDNDDSHSSNTKETTVKPKTMNIECYYCCAKVKTYKELKEHATRHTLLENPFECTICGLKDIPSRSRLTYHLNAHNPKSKNKEKRCNICEEVLSSTLNLKIHKETNHPGPTPYKCKFCTKQYSTRWPLDVHMRTHTGDRPYTCEICGKTFTVVSSLRLHERSHSKLTPRPFVCEKCGVVFKSVGLLNSHVKKCGKSLNSSSDKQIKCFVCYEGFNDDQDLKMHIKTHHPCPCECDLFRKSLNETSSFHQLMKRHKSSFVCDICGATFTHLGLLNRHTKSHQASKVEAPEKILCNICGQMIRRKCLNAHIRTHTGEKPYQCTHCSKAFRDTSSFRRHTMTHTGVKPHKCDICGKSFIQTTQLRKHMHSHEKRGECTETVPQSPRVIIEQNFNPDDLDFIDQI